MRRLLFVLFSLTICASATAKPKVMSTADVFEFVRSCNEAFTKKSPDARVDIPLRTCGCLADWTRGEWKKTGKFQRPSKKNIRACIDHAQKAKAKDPARRSPYQTGLKWNSLTLFNGVNGCFNRTGTKDQGKRLKGYTVTQQLQGCLCLVDRFRGKKKRKTVDATMSQVSDAEAEVCFKKAKSKK